MKIRNGFVSNSSSSSFVVYGFKLNGDEQYSKYDGLNDQLQICEQYYGVVLSYDNDSFEFTIQDILKAKSTIQILVPDKASECKIYVNSSCY